jgi:hypothetical protein
MGEDFKDAMAWLDVEHKLYESKKFGEEVDDTRDLLDWFPDKVAMYYKRAEILGLDNPLGRQAFAKATMTAVGGLATLFRQYHWIPMPGFPSGELRGDFPKQEDSECPS